MLKRDLKLFARCLISAAVFLLVTAVICGAAAEMFAKNGKKLFSPVKLAVVTEENSLVNRILINTVLGTEYFSDLFDVRRMNYNEAQRAFRAGDAAGIIVLPAGYLDDIAAGREAYGTIQLSSALQGQSEIIESVARFGELMVLAGQNGVFVGEKLITEHKYGRAVRKSFLDSSNKALLKEAISGGSKYFRFEFTDFGDTAMSAKEHYALCWTVMTAFLVSAIFIPLFLTDMKSGILCRLRSCGRGASFYLKYKLLFTALFRLLLILASVYMICGKEAMTAAGMASCAAAALYITLLGACLSMCFGGGIPVIGIFSALGLFLCGGLVPRPMMNRILVKIGDLLPFGAARDLLLPAFGGHLTAAGAAAAVLYSSAAVLLLLRTYSRVLRGGDGK